MAGPQHRSAWPQVRRGLVIFALLVGGMSALSLLGGRPGDFAAGLVGAVGGAAAAAVVVAIELVGRRFARKASQAQDAEAFCQRDT